MSRVVLGIAAAMALSAGGLADVTFHQGESKIGVLLGKATFDGLKTRDPLQNYKEDGLTLDVDDFEFVFTPRGFPPEWGPPYYPNGGVFDQVNITRSDGQRFEVLEMNVSHGWGGFDIFVWMQAYLDDALVDEFDVDVRGGTLIGLTGAFDEVRIASFFTADLRDEHKTSNLNAIALDNVAFGLSSACDPCDANCDGSVDPTDVEPFIKLLLGGKPCEFCAGDTNDDGSIDLTDVEGFIECLLG